jgi:ATP adenylyltransferase
VSEAVPGLERLWAGWRSAFVTSVAAGEPNGEGVGASDCVFCGLLASGRTDDETHILWRHPTRLAIAILNLYPYTSGHLMVMPTRHVAEVEEVMVEESAERPGRASPATSTSTWCPGGMATPTS